MNIRPTYGERRDFGDSRIDQAKAILADYFRTNISDIQTASDYLDCKEATDLLVGECRVALRCRESSYLSRYPNDITIRLERKSGLSEWQKIQSGCVDFILYAFIDPEGLRAWRLIDLAELLGCLRWAEGTPWALTAQRHAPEGKEPFMSIDLSPLDRNRSARAALIVAEG